MSPVARRASGRGRRPCKHTVNACHAALEWAAQGESLPCRGTYSLTTEPLVELPYYLTKRDMGSNGRGAISPPPRTSERYTLEGYLEFLEHWLAKWVRAIVVARRQAIQGRHPPAGCGFRQAQDHLDKIEGWHHQGASQIERLRGHLDRPDLCREM